MSRSNFIIPTENIPQRFVINLANVNYTLTFKWNDADEAGWILDIGDEANNPIACGLPLVTGADVLANLEYLGINGSIVVFTTGDPNAVPTLENLGSACLVYFQTDVASNGN